MSNPVSGKKLLDETCEIMQRFHYSIHTERSYCGWIRQFIHFHKLQTRESLFFEPKRKVEAFLTHLAIQCNVAASTQNQAFNALLFLYKRVLNAPLEGIESARSRKEQRIPVVLTQEEVKQVLTLLNGVSEIPVKLLYGSGLRITEAVRLRVQDIDYGYKQVTVRNGKGTDIRTIAGAVSFLVQYPSLSGLLFRQSAAACRAILSENPDNNSINSSPSSHSPA